MGTESSFGSGYVGSAYDVDLPARGWVRAFEAAANSRSWSLIRMSQSASSSMISADDRLRLMILVIVRCRSIQVEGEGDSLLDRVHVSSPTAYRRVPHPAMSTTSWNSAVGHLLSQHSVDEVDIQITQGRLQGHAVAAVGP